MAYINNTAEGPIAIGQPVSITFTFELFSYPFAFIRWSDYVLNHLHETTMLPARVEI